MRLPSVRRARSARYRSSSGLTRPYPRVDAKAAVIAIAASIALYGICNHIASFVRTK